VGRPPPSQLALAQAKPFKMARSVQNEVGVYLDKNRAPEKVLLQAPRASLAYVIGLTHSTLKYPHQSSLSTLTISDIVHLFAYVELLDR